MSFKDLLVHVDGTRHCAARLRLAMSLARRFDAHAQGLYVAPPVGLSPFLADQFPPALLEEAHARAAQRRESARASFDAAAAGRTAKVQWSDVTGDAIEILTRAARHADLTILGQSASDDLADMPPGLPEQVVIGAGRPALVVPYAGRFDTVGERILVAWNGSAQAARALGDAMPLLCTAKRVLVMNIHPQGELLDEAEISGAEVRTHLSRHGIEAELSRIPETDIGIGDILLSRAADAAADLIVMGVYGHSRMRELVLGGASRHLFEHMTVPVVMAH